MHLPGSLHGAKNQKFITKLTDVTTWGLTFCFAICISPLFLRESGFHIWSRLFSVRCLPLSSSSDSSQILTVNRVYKHFNSLQQNSQTETLLLPTAQLWMNLFDTEQQQRCSISAPSYLMLHTDVWLRKSASYERTLKCDISTVVRMQIACCGRSPTREGRPLPTIWRRKLTLRRNILSPS
jgi:hypothetical protein